MAKGDLHLHSCGLPYHPICSCLQSVSSFLLFNIFIAMLLTLLSVCVATIILKYFNYFWKICLNTSFFCMLCNSYMQGNSLCRIFSSIHISILQSTITVGARLAALFLVHSIFSISAATLITPILFTRIVH